MGSFSKTIDIGALNTKDRCLTGVKSQIRMASVSCLTLTTLSVRFNGVEVEQLYLAAGVPHTWWAHTGQRLIPAEQISSTDAIEFVVLVGGPIAVRVDYDEIP